MYVGFFDIEFFEESQKIGFFVPCKTDNIFSYFRPWSIVSLNLICYSRSAWRVLLLKRHLARRVGPFE